MKRSRLVLLGALLWFAWHLGTLSAPQPEVSAPQPEVSAPQPEVHRDRHRMAHELAGHEFPGNASSSGESANLNTGLQRFAVESERLLDHSARTLKTDSSELMHHMHQSAQAPGHPIITERESVPASNTPISAVQNGLAMAWHQVQPLVMSIPPLAKAGWEMVQAGWRQWNPIQPHPEQAASGSDSNATWGDHQETHHHSAHRSHHLYAHHAATEDLAEQP